VEVKIKLDRQKSLLEEYDLVGEPVDWNFKDGKKTYFVIGGEVKKISTGEVKNLGLMQEVFVTKTDLGEVKYNFGDPEIFEVYMQNGSLGSKKIELTDKYYNELASAFQVD